MSYVSIAVEGPSDVAVARRVVAAAGCSVHLIYGRGGKSQIDARISGYNQAARHAPWLVLRDLDQDADCAPTLTKDLLPNPSRWMRFRIAVREMESWLLADPERLSAYLKVSRALMPTEPEALPDPKFTLVRLASRSRSATMRQDIVPADGTTARIGPGYVSRVSEFAQDHWRPEVARLSSPSLHKCIKRLAELTRFRGRST